MSFNLLERWHFNPGHFNSRLFNHELFIPMVQKFMVEKSGLKSSWLKSLGLKGPGLKLGVEKSGIEMSFNLLNALTLTPKNKRKLLCFFYWLYSQSAGLFRHTRKLGNPIETRLGLGSYSRRRHIGIVSAHENHHIEYILSSLTWRKSSETTNIFLKSKTFFGYINGKMLAAL